DVVVRVTRALAAALAAEERDRAVGDALVGIHVGLRARAGLPHDQREVLVELPVGNFPGSPGDRLGQPWLEQPEPRVDPRGGALDDPERADHAGRHALPADTEVLEAALGLRAPQPVGGNLYGPEGVGFGAGMGHGVKMRPRQTKENRPEPRGRAV